MTSAVARLQSLPEAFTFAAFCKLTGLSKQAAAVWLNRWKKKNLIEPAGDRAGIYFNKLKCPAPDSSLRIEALLYEYPSAILCGESVLHATGWITQIPARLTVAVLRRPTYVSFHGFEIRGQPLSWLRRVQRAVNAPSNDRIYGMRALPPAFALVDLYADSRAWHPDVDDLDIPAEDADAVRAASRALDVKLPEGVFEVVAPGK